MTGLFAEPQELVTVEKLGMEARLSDKVEEWPQEILQEVLRQHPYLGQYDVSPVMRDTEDERGYALGFLVVRNRTSRLNTPSGRALASDAGVRTVKVPVIVVEQKLKDVDVFMDPRGRPMPLNERRVRQALFRPELFDSYGDPPTNATLIGDQLMPPDRSDRMLSGHGSSVEKTSSEKGLLLEAISPTIIKSDLDRVTRTMNESPALSHMLIKNAATLPLVQILGSVDPVSSSDVARAVIDNVEPDTRQLFRNGDSYILKQANSQMYAPEFLEADRINMVQIVGPDIVRAVDEHNVATLSTAPVVVKEADEGAEAEIVERFGEYKVRDNSDREHLGWVFPHVVDFDGKSLPLKVFTNGTAAAVQADIAGVLVGKGTNITSSDELKGDGMFFRQGEEGVTGFVPGRITTTFEDETGPGIMFETVVGERSKLRLVPGLKRPVAVGGNEYSIPSDVGWSPLQGPALSLVEDPGHFAKTAAVVNDRTVVKIVSDGQTWSFGGQPLGKLAADHRQFLNAEDALFLSCCLGMDARYAMMKLAVAGQLHEPVYVNGCREIVPISSVLSNVEATAEKIAAEMPPKYDLLKEAANLDDMSTADKVLSLGFLTPENIATFIDYLPEMEEALQKLAHLLVSVRVGLPDVPEQSVKNAMERLEEVCQALRELVYRKT
jgi:hypothetical protein